LYSSVDPERDQLQLLNKLVRMGMRMSGITREVGWIGKRGKRRVTAITSFGGGGKNMNIGTMQDRSLLSVVEEGQLSESLPILQFIL